jgi:iron complex transport system permease protein
LIPLTARRTLATLLVLSMALTALIALSLAIGSERIPPGDILAALISRLRAGTSALSPEQDVILFSLRLPRIGLAAGVGAVLAVAGASFQALLRNPLADPYILGVSGGAALGSILGIMFAGDMVYGRPLMSFAGAAVASFVVYRLGRRDDDPARLVLAGVVISTFLSSVIALVISLAEDVKLRNITLWLLGDLSSGTIGGLVFVLSAAVVGVAVLLTQARALNLMMVGERDAFALGVETGRVRWIVYAAASLLTGAAVSAGGAIGYVGLVVPHLVRLASGADNRLVIPASALAGAFLVLLADTTARVVIAPRELPTGAITAIVGAPIFIFLLLRGRS